MARFVLVTNGITSTTHTGLELAHRLIAAGHEATLVCHRDLTDTAARRGVPFVELTADREAFGRLHALIGAARSFPRPAAVGALLRLPGAAWRARRDTASATELHRVIAQLDPDAVVVDTEAHVAIAALAASDTPVVLSTFLFDIDPAGGAPPLDSRLLPGAEGVATAWDATLAEGARLRRRRRASRRGLIDLFGPISYAANGVPALRAVARRNGYRLSEIARTDGWLRPVWYPELLTLSTNLAELEFGSGPANWRYVGPMVDVDERRSQWRTADDEHRWSDLLARRERLTDPPALVYCSLGTYRATDRDLIERMIAAVSDQPALQVVIGLGARAAARDFGEVPSNVTLLEWADQVAVLRHADVAVVHGGNATLNECVALGVPMVACSTGFLDQHGVCARIEHAGIGRRIERSASSEQIARAIVDVLADDALRSRVEDLSSVASDATRRRLAVDVLVDIAQPGH